ncbi:Uncharacterised protein [Zhongshania aliphaticivorans]|uniref:MotA/TolQ/ExbB proton channel domain-containing protein n=1 Tax=Zhongshania aliphaticivorans TaxID=1470434 RepID=A0A5S9MV05_9GAMM|nr:anti-phage ZorAB system protein ZorA [Zhongshania aliphaticivorans]CAA0081072.1 Uncharacterised protein [Zhongshania aliphaticivorans]CAA0085289.1 Uncharacterised protein [Zhongshania aliphaticivorans]
MSNQVLDVSSLIPDLALIAQGDFRTPDGFSAFLVAALFTIFLIFLVLTITSYFRARKQLGFYSRLVKDLKAEELLTQRQDITNRAKEHKTYRQLWQEFNESLVEVNKSNRLCNTIDAAHFFNTHTLAKGLTENRLIAAVPGFLTAIGVIGTFAGLQMGLDKLGVSSSETASSSELTKGIFGMIGGASIAFMTSVWGIFFSVLFNFIEKSFERNIRNAISAFQNKIDYLYPRITAEQSLSHIEEFSRQSNERLAELDEKIGNRLQEAVRESSAAIQQGIQDSLHKVLAPAIEQLVNNANSGSEKALGSLLDKYMSGMGDMGSQHQKLIDGATEQLGNAAQNMTQGMDGFLGKLDEHVGNISKQNDSALENMQSKLASQLEVQQEKDDNRQLLINEQIRKVDHSQSALSEKLGQIVEGHDVQYSKISASIDALLSRFQQLMDSHTLATNSMKSISGEIQGASNQLGVLSQNTKEANSAMKEGVEHLSDSLERTTSENRKTFEESQKVQENISKLLLSVEEVSNKLQRTAEFADLGLKSVGQHFNELGTSLHEHVDKLESQVSHLLNEYSSQVQAQTTERLNHWNNQTAQYTGEMTRAVQTLSSIVDEMESKLDA